MKVSEKIHQSMKEGKVSFSFEFFPPKTQDGVENLFDRMDRLVSLHPIFCDITWGAGGSTAELTLDIATRMQTVVCVETMMHLTCTNMPVEKIDDALEKVKDVGITNILALRGDPPHGQDTFVAVEGGFRCALDLVRHIRAKHGDYFGITVAGYPEAHPEKIADPSAGATAEAYHEDLLYLKSKVDAGAEVIVTQLFYDVERFLKFYSDCREIGIDVPIVPGIMPISNYNGFKRMTTFCKTAVPAEISAALEDIKDNDEAIRSYGINLATEMCKRILAAGVNHVHLYTLNLERSAMAILERLGVIQDVNLARPLPWRPPVSGKRSSERVRPIHWANRPKSYLIRTREWEEFPKGRWGDCRSAAYGSFNDHQFTRPKSRDNKLKKEWGSRSYGSVDDVKEMFVKYCKGELKSFPWSEAEGLLPETKKINDNLVRINGQGFMTVNSQPAVNGEKSDAPLVGWGGRGGYVYQKAYVEFFCSPQKLTSLVERIESSFPSISYMAVTADGDVKSNVSSEAVNAVTWGVFPAREVIQPTVVDPASFMVWKDEAFAVWGNELGTVAVGGDVAAKEVMECIRSTFWLVCVVDNDYVNGDLFAIFQGL
ncbi:hypothetical protein CBR_g37215 [Chara braunii]|uniref:methylenetetrahydrofolate reductase (NADH) n=1 Tax=Chara braunii TaxID=69332 RepID=A0A388LMJ7_CHABU|nr:hypothetical protein CBR_g37215 [Chara braunii]|eukprot:GBG83501.1 hypothetical protein CBR_g37215 [Chara braunii]